MPELSAAPADAAVTGTDRLLNTDFEYILVQQVADANESKSANIASAATTDVGAATAPFVHITGTTTITALGTIQAGTRRIVVFDDILILTHNASSLILPTGANITTAAGDVAVFVSEGSGNWRCVDYMRANGTALVASGGMTNPMTTTGDMIYSSSGSTPARLGIGTNGEVLTLVGGVPVWASAGSGAVSSVNGDIGAVIVAAPICIACSDETTALTTGVAKVTFRMPYAFTLTGVRASVTTAPTGSVLTVDINEGGSTILSTKITIDATEKTSTTAATPPVISDTALADDAEITIDIDTVGSTIAGAGLKVWLLGYAT